MRKTRVDAAPWRPHGRALLDFSDGDTSARVIVHGDDGETEIVPIRVFFRGPSAFSALEETALDLCRGRVLDAGAGAGCHSLVLQEQGLSVCAIDLAPEAVEVMQKRGVKDARCADLFHFQDGPFDTILLMMNGIGVVGDLAGLDRFLADVHRLLAPDGQILLDSYDPTWTEESPAGAGHDAWTSNGRYIGEMRFQLEYKGRKGPTLSWLFLDSKLLIRRRHAEAGEARASLGHWTLVIFRAGGARWDAGPGSRRSRAPRGHGRTGGP